MSPFDSLRRRLGRGGGEPEQRIPRQDRRGPSNLRIGLIALVAIAIGTYFGFAKSLPWSSSYELRAVFENASNIKPNSPVRIAGVNVGTVTESQKADDSDATVVVMEIQDKGLPIHQDAVLKIRPRIFLEGNFFMDLQPGTPSAPTVDSGGTIGISQTATSVQLDEVLTALQRPTRGDLQTLLQEFSKGLDNGGAEGLNESFRYSGDAFKNSAKVNQALLGEQPDDLSKLVAGQQKVFAALDKNESSLQDFITNFNITTGALASESANLSATVRDLERVLVVAQPALANLNLAFPPTRELARLLVPAAKATPATVDAAIDSGWITQARKLLSQDELGGLAADLRPTGQDLARVEAGQLKLLPQANNVALCFTKVILPTGDIKITANNGYPANLVSGEENYKEFWYALVGLSGEGQSFDGNGALTRFTIGGGPSLVKFGNQQGSGAPQFGNAYESGGGSRPAYNGKLPAFKSDVPCYKNSLPDVNSAQVKPSAASAYKQGKGQPRSGEPNPLDGPLNKPLPGVDTRQVPVAPDAGGGGTSVLNDLVGLLNPFGRVR